MTQGNIKNFAIIVLVNGRTHQVKLTKEQKRLFASLTLGTMGLENKPLGMMPIDDMIQLQPDHEAFSS